MNEAKQWRSSVKYLAYLVRCACEQIPYAPQLIHEHYAQYKRCAGKPHAERKQKCAEAWEEQSG